MAKSARRDPALKLLVRVGSTEVTYEGEGAFLSAELPRVLDLITRSHNTRVKTALQQEVEAAQAAHSTLDDSHAHGARLQEELVRGVDAFRRGVAGYLSQVAAGGSSEQQLAEATRQMQETQMSFNLQYLQLQSQMQHENRSYTAVSNIMKTKHDTVKNSISNIR